MLESKINDIRTVASKIDRKQLSKETFETLKYDQILSIIGGRGAGKTSILLTLYEKLKNNKENIVLPIIMPELIDSDESIISWLLSAMKENLKNVEDEIELFGVKNRNSEYASMCSEYGLFDRCIFNKNNELRNKFSKLENAYYMKSSKNVVANYPDNQYLRARMVENSFKLMQMFVDYWNALVDVYSKYLKESRKLNDVTPLIFIFIDDTDLKPQIINELLFVIPKYLSHPNVVVFVSAAHKTLAYAVKNHMYESLTKSAFDLPDLMQAEYNYNGESYINDNSGILSFHELHYGKEYDKIKRLSDEILRKLFPVNNRFYIKKFDRYEDKKLFQIFENEEYDCDSSVRLSDRLINLFINFENDIYITHESHIGTVKISNENVPGQYEPSNKTIEEKKKFFYLSKMESTHSIDNEMYLSFFGRYPRDIMAVFYSLKEMLTDLKETLKRMYNGHYGDISIALPVTFNEKIYEIIIKFLNAAISSNRKFSMFSSIVCDLVKTQLLHWQLYVDYAKVLEVFRDEKYIFNNKKNCDAFVEMICLLNFIEQIIVLVMPQRRKSHGYEVFLELMRLCDIKVIQYSDDLNNMFKQYFTFHSLNIIPKFDINKLEHQNNFIVAIDYLKLIDSKKINKLKKYSYEWCELLSNVFFKRFNPVARLNEYKEELFILRNYNYAGEKYTTFRNIFIKKIKETVEQRKNSRKTYPKDYYSVELMEEYQFKLRICIENLMLSIKFDNEDINALISELSYFDNNKVKKEIASFSEYIKDNEVFPRSSLISRLNTIRSVIEMSDYEYLDLRNWYSRFEKCLDRNVIIDENIEDNSTYFQILDTIGENETYQLYIEYYINLILKSIETENAKMPLTPTSKDIKKIIEPYINNLEKREWRKLTEME